MKLDALNVSTEFPTEYPELLVQMIYLAGDEAFVCGISGGITLDAIKDIESECNDNLDECFPDGEGDYLFCADFFPGQYDGEGRCELRPGWELTKLAFWRICAGLKDGEPQYA